MGPVSRSVSRSSLRPGAPAPQAGLARPHDRLGPVADLELREDVRDVVADGLGRQAEGRGDVGVGPPLGDQLEDLALALGELGKRGGVDAGRRPREVGHQPARHAGPEDRLARRHRPDRPEQLGPLGALEQVAARSGPDRLEHRLIVVVTSSARGRRRGASRRRSGASPRRRRCPGMLTSIRTTSGWDRRTATTASSPVAASPTTSTSPAVSSSARRPPRNAAWSSAISTRIVEPGSVTRSLFRAAAARRPAFRPRVGARRRPRRRPRRRARAWTRGRSRPRRLRDAAAVVRHLDRQLAAGLEPDPARARAGVADGVGHRLDRDPVRRDLDRRGQLGQLDRLALDVDRRRPGVGVRAAGRVGPPAGRSRRRGPARRAPAAAARRPAAGRRRAPRGPRRPAPPAAVGAAAGSSSSTAADASARIPIAASDGPRPSWRSRRSRRRSSSRATTSRSRDRARASRSCCAWIAAPAWRARSWRSASSSGRKPRSPLRTPSTSRPTGSAPWTRAIAWTSATGVPCSATTWLPPTSSVTSTTTYGRRSASATVSAMAGKARPGPPPTPAASRGAASPATARRAGRTSAG